MVAEGITTLNMSLDDFFKKPSTRSSQRAGNKNEAMLLSQDGEDEPEPTNAEDGQDFCSEQQQEATAARDDRVVERMTRNIEKLLDAKLANVLKPVTEMSEKLDKLVDRVGTVEQPVSDLEDITAADSPQLASVEQELKKSHGKTREL